MLYTLGCIILSLILLGMLFGRKEPDPMEERHREEQRKATQEHDDRMYELERERLQLERDRFEWECLCRKENHEPVGSSTPGMYIPRRRLL